MLSRLIVFLALGGVGGQLLQCPHPRFVLRHVCDSCENELQVRNYLVEAGVSGVLAVFGPPHSNNLPLFRPTGMDPRDSCVNRQPRPAYRCNINSRRPYCFRIGAYCYGGHSSLTGQLDSDFISCMDNYEWSSQHELDDYNTNRRSDPEVQ